jgi:hypothetical protein
MRRVILSLTLVLPAVGCGEKTEPAVDAEVPASQEAARQQQLPARPAPAITPNLPGGPAQANRASQLANAEAKRQHAVEPFSPRHFVRAVYGGRTVFTAITPWGFDDLKAEVSFGTDTPPDVHLSIITSHLWPEGQPLEAPTKTEAVYTGTFEFKEIQTPDAK